MKRAWGVVFAAVKGCEDEDRRQRGAAALPPAGALVMSAEFSEPTEFLFFAFQIVC